MVDKWVKDRLVAFDKYSPIQSLNIKWNWFCKNNITCYTISCNTISCNTISCNNISCNSISCNNIVVFIVDEVKTCTLYTRACTQGSCFILNFVRILGFYQNFSNGFIHHFRAFVYWYFCLLVVCTCAIEKGVSMKSVLEW